MELITNSEYEVFNDYYINGELIKKAYVVQGCNVVEENKSIGQIIDTIKEKEENNLCEFAWYSLQIKINKPMTEAFEITNMLLDHFKQIKDIEIYLGDGYIILTGNANSWLNCLRDYATNVFSKSIYLYLSTINPSIFPRVSIAVDDTISVSLVNKHLIQNKDKTLNDNPLIFDGTSRKKHDWFSVLFKDVSHSFINEIISFRDLSFVEFNNYLTVNKNFKFSIDTTPMSKNKTDIDKIENCLKVVQETYNYLINRGRKRDVVRQLLPIGMTKQILVGMTIENWEKLFKEKTKDKSHWEVKTILNDLKDELNENYKYEF